MPKSNRSPVRTVAATPPPAPRRVVPPPAPPRRAGPPGRQRGGDGGKGGAIATAAVAYLRRSTDRQEQSIPDQLRTVQAYCDREGLVLLRSYTDDAISGTSSLGRKAFQKLMADAQGAARDFAFVVAYDVKRFGRVDNDEAGYYRHLLRSAGVEVRYASENFNGDGTDDLLRPVKQWQAREESKDLSKVTIRGLLTKSTTGAWMGGAPPYGYDLRYQSQSGMFLLTLRYNQDGTKAVLDDKGKFQRTLERGESIAVSRKDHCTLVPGDPVRVATVQRIFRLYTAEARGFKAIADKLNAEGVPSARSSAWAAQYSGQWSMTTVRALLLNPAYGGDMVWNRRTDARFHSISEGRAVERRGVMGRRLEDNGQEDWVVVKDAHPALVSRRTFELAQQVMARRPGSEDQKGINQRTGQKAGLPERRGGGWTGPRARFVFSGLCTCARCGSRYEGYTLRGNKKDAEGVRAQWRHYACGGAIRRGKSVCELGLVGQEELESAVMTAMVTFYKRYSGPSGRAKLERAVRQSVGGQNNDLETRRRAAQERITAIDALVAKLLDTVSASTREASQRRIAQLDGERRGLRSELESLDRLGLTDSEAEGLVRENAAFLAGLEHLIQSGTVGERQAAVRRCLKEAVVDAAHQTATTDLRIVPIAVHGNGHQPIRTVRVPLS
jgi:DNA invertase Pin-like site-specific DNA recombinase